MWQVLYSHNSSIKENLPFEGNIKQDVTFDYQTGRNAENDVVCNPSETHTVTHVYHNVTDLSLDRQRREEVLGS